VIAVFGIISGGKQKSAKDYFIGSKSVPWWAVCFSIVAAETSTLTFISIPGLAYLTNLNFLQVTIGYLIGRIIVANYFLTLNTIKANLAPLMHF
jgi:SSS family solute:Na+ symporter